MRHYNLTIRNLDPRIHTQLNDQQTIENFSSLNNHTQVLNK